MRPSGRRIIPNRLANTGDRPDRQPNHRRPCQHRNRSRCLRESVPRLNDDNWVCGRASIVSPSLPGRRPLLRHALFAEPHAAAAGIALASRLCLWEDGPEGVKLRRRAACASAARALWHSMHAHFFAFLPADSSAGCRSGKSPIA